MAAVTFQQTDDAHECIAGAYCSLLSANGNFDAIDAQKDGSAGSSEITVPMDVSATNLRGFHYSLRPVVGMAGDAGDWIVRINNTDGHSDLTLASIYICQVSTLCSNKTTIGTLTGLSDSLDSVGVIEKTVSGGAVTMLDTDKVIILLGITNGSSMFARTVGFTPDQIITSPFDDGVEATVSVGKSSKVGTGSALIGTGGI